MTENQGTIVAVVDDEESSDGIVQRVTQLGLEAGARVVLYDIGATAGPFESPLPTQFAADGPDRGVPPLLSAQELDAAGQPILAGRVRALAEAGIDAYGWLPEKGDAERLGSYARTVGATRIIAASGVGPKPDDLRSVGIEIETV